MNWKGTLGVDSLDLFGVFSSRRKGGHFCCGFAGAMCGEALGLLGFGDSDLDAVRLRARMSPSWVWREDRSWAQPKASLLGRWCHSLASSSKCRSRRL